METVKDFIFLGSKITEDSDCSHGIKRCLLLGRKAIAIPDNVFKSRDITFLTKLPLVKAMVFQQSSMDVRVGPEELCFQTVELEKALESPLDCKEIKPVNPKGNQS